MSTEKDNEPSVNRTTRRSGAGVASLDRPPRFGNCTRRYVDPAREPERYLRLRRAEFTCRGLATSLRCNREQLRGKSPSEAEALIGIPPNSIASLEAGDPCSPVGSWIKVWSWLGYLEDVNREACMGTLTWGDALAAFVQLPDMKRDLLMAFLGLDAATLQDMQESSPQTEIHFWLNAWAEMRILRRVHDAAFPSVKIRVAQAEARAAAMQELDAELIRKLEGLE